MRSRSSRQWLPAWLMPIAILALAAAAILPVTTVGTARAQDVPPELMERAARESGLTQAQLMRVYQTGEMPDQTDSTQTPGLTELPRGPQVVLPLSEYEDNASATDSVPEVRTATGAPVFGSDFFGGDPSLFGAETFGPVPGDYLLGPGDEVTVDVWGEVEFRYERIVDRTGAIILPKAGRIPCANRTLDQVSQSIREALSGSYSGIDPSGEGGNTFVETSLGRLRAIRVFVVGEVARPGGYELSSVATVFTALFAAGGPGATGSMRNVSLMRGGEEVGRLDLYDYLLSGDRSGDLILRAGDTVFVPAREVTVEISGAVRRPMAFELRDGEGLADLLHFAGGFESDANTAVVHVDRILPPQERRPNQPDRIRLDIDLTQRENVDLVDGDILTVTRIPERLTNWVEIRGNVKQPGRYEFHEGLTVADLVARAGGLWKDTVLERAVLDREDEQGNYRSSDVALGPALDPTGPGFLLQNRDSLLVFSIWDLEDRATVDINGEVRRPGSFDWRSGMTLRDLVLKAGGFALGADLLHAEIARLKTEAIEQRDPASPPEKVVEVFEVELGEDWLQSASGPTLEPYDVVSIRRLPWWQRQRTVSIRGEVAYPGRYVLDRADERLSSVVARAGGLRSTAYAEGARITRGLDRIGNVALDLRQALDDVGGDHDLILESGDQIIVPPMPYTVKVTGAVNFSTSVIWEKGKDIGDYVSRAGGRSENADKWKTHVVYANGESRPVKRFWPDPEVRPGSTIVVPVKPAPQGDGKLETFRDIASIIASVAMVWLVVDSTN